MCLPKPCCKSINVRGCSQFQHGRFELKGVRAVVCQPSTDVCFRISKAQRTHLGGLPADGPGCPYRLSCDAAACAASASRTTLTSEPLARGSGSSARAAAASCSCSVRRDTGLEL